MICRVGKYACPPIIEQVMGESICGFDFVAELAYTLRNALQHSIQ